MMNFKDCSTFALHNPVHQFPLKTCESQKKKKEKKWQMPKKNKGKQYKRVLNDNVT